MLAIDHIAILDFYSGRLTNDHETEKNRGGSTALESATGTNEETSANGTTPIESQSVYCISCLQTRRPKTHMAIICMCLPLRLLCRVFSP